MKKSIARLCVGVILVCTSLLADSIDQSGFLIFLDAGVPIRGAEGRYGADFGNVFLDLSARACLAGNFFFEGTFNFFPEPRPNDPYFYNSDGFELAINGVWKFAAMKKISPFLKIGVSYAWISSGNAYADIYYPDAGRQTDRWLGVNVGGGIEYRLNKRLLLRLSGAFTLVPNDGEGAIASWGKVFAGIGLRI